MSPKNAAIVTCVTFALPPMARPVEPPLTPAETARKVALLTQEFTRTKGDPNRRREIAREVHSLQPDAVRPLVAAAEGEIAADTRSYLMAFVAEAKRSADAKRRAADRKQAEGWQKILVDREVNTAYLKDKAAPAMKDLRAAVTVTPAEVLDGAAALAGQRETLLKEIDAVDAYRGLLPDPAAGPRRTAPPSPQALKAAVERDEHLLAMIALPMSPADQATMEGNFRLRDQIDPQEALGVCEVNVMRILMQLPPVEIDVKLCEAARAHSRDMVEKGFFSHDSPVAGKHSFMERARLAGTTASGECIARGQGSFAGANSAWFHSPGHHSIMFSRGARRMGYGRHERHWTLMTGG